METKLNETQIEKALYRAIIMSFYDQDLLNVDEMILIRKELRKHGISLDSITLKSDVCTKEVSNDE